MLLMMDKCCTVAAIHGRSYSFFSYAAKFRLICSNAAKSSFLHVSHVPPDSGNFGFRKCKIDIICVRIVSGVGWSGPGGRLEADPQRKICRRLPCRALATSHESKRPSRVGCWGPGGPKLAAIIPIGFSVSGLFFRCFAGEQKVNRGRNV